VAEHLVHEEGVSLGFRVHGPRQRRALVAKVMASHRSDELNHLEITEPGQRQALHSRVASEISQDLSQRMAAAEVGVSVRAQDEHTLQPVGPQEMAQQEQGRFASPVEVVEHEDHSGVRRHGRQPRDHRLEEQEALGLGVGRLSRPSRRLQVEQTGHEPRQRG
jgi:hypothetical protein